MIAATNDGVATGQAIGSASRGVAKAPPCRPSAATRVRGQETFASAKGLQGKLAMKTTRLDTAEYLMSPEAQAELVSEA